MKGKMTILASATMALAGCVTYGPVALPDGTQGYAIHCDGLQFDVSDCMNKAAELCHGKYQPVTADTYSPGGVAAGNGVYVSGLRRTYVVGCQH